MVSTANNKLILFIYKKYIDYIDGETTTDYAVSTSTDCTVNILPYPFHFQFQKLYARRVQAPL